MNAIQLNDDQKPVLQNIDPPRAGEGEVIVDLEYSGINRRDYWITKGLYPGIQTGITLGSDGAGLYQGDRVLINPGLNWGGNPNVQSQQFEVLGMPSDGTFADQIVIPKSYIHTIPDHLSTQEAAALPLAGLTAYRVLFTRCACKEGDRVLISGVGGGVAHLALLFAIHTGAEVFVTSGDHEKISRAVALGAKEGVNYREDDWPQQLKNLVPEGFDVIIDSAAGEGFKEFIPLAAPGGRIGIYGGTKGKIQEINPQVLFWRQISILGSTMGNIQDFTNMLALVSEHKIRPVVDQVIPLTDFSRGFKALASSSQFGKVVFDHNA